MLFLGPVATQLSSPLGPWYSVRICDQRPLCFPFHLSNHLKIWSLQLPLQACDIYPSKGRPTLCLDSCLARAYSNEKTPIKVCWAFQKLFAATCFFSQLPGPESPKCHGSPIRLVVFVQRKGFHVYITRRPDKRSVWSVCKTVCSVVELFMPTA